MLSTDDNTIWWDRNASDLGTFTNSRSRSGFYNIYHHFRLKLGRTRTKIFVHRLLRIRCSRDSFLCEHKAKTFRHICEMLQSLKLKQIKYSCSLLFQTDQQIFWDFRKLSGERNISSILMINVLNTRFSESLQSNSTQHIQRSQCNSIITIQLSLTNWTAQLIGVHYHIHVKNIDQNTNLLSMISKYS